MNDHKQVLVVDDEDQVCCLTQRALSLVSIDCDTASDGAEAMRLMQDKNYDAIITDLRMPRRHGHALCGDIMRLPSPPHIVVLTGVNDARLVRDLMGRGVQDVVVKPVDYDVFAAKIEVLVSQPKRLLPSTNQPQQNKPAQSKANLLREIESTLLELSELSGDRLAELFLNIDDLPDPPRSVREYIRRLSEGEAASEAAATGAPSSGAPRSRTKQRVICCTAATARPVDRHWKPTGEAFRVAMRDLSEGGARMLHTRSTNASFLALSWQASQLVDKQLRVVCQVRRCQPTGPFYDIGGQFAMAD